MRMKSLQTFPQNVRRLITPLENKDLVINVKNLMEVYSIPIYRIRKCSSKLHSHAHWIDAYQYTISIRLRLVTRYDLQFKSFSKVRFDSSLPRSQAHSVELF